MINDKDLDTIINDVTWSYEESGMNVPQNILNTFNEIKQIQSILNEYNVTPENIREVLLTGQMFRNQPTLDECIKEWEERGWTVDELKQFPIIKIWKLNKEQNVVDNIYVYPKKLNSTIDFNADYGTLNLLTKTLKAVEVENENSGKN